MRQRTLLFTVLLCLSSLAAAAEVQWQAQDFQAAAAKASAEGKLVYIFVEGDHCPPCDAFKASHLNDPAFIDFVNAVYVPIRVHEGDPAGRAFLESMRLVHAAVPRFYTMTPEGRGVSMSIGMVSAPPMGAVDVLKLAFGRELPVNREAAAALAGRLRSHAANQRATGQAGTADNPLRYMGLAILEAQAWAFAGRLDEAENAWGAPWAEQLVDQDIRALYITFWVRWNRNAQGSIKAAQAFHNASPDDPAGRMFLAMAFASGGNYAEAVREGEAFLSAVPDNAQFRQQVDAWRAQGGR